jgi:hypothetical protein
VTPRPWRSGFCTTDDALPWQHAACDRNGAGHSRTPTKADPRDWVPCACSCHRPPEETPVTVRPLPEQEVPPLPETFDAAALDDPGPPLPIALTLLQLATQRLSEAAVDNIEPLDWEDAIRLLDQLRTAVATLQEIDSLLVRQIYLRGPHGKNAAELDGIGPVSIGRTADRKNWDERGVARAVIDARMADTTGEPPDPWDVAEWLLEVYGVSYCRLTPLRGLGIEPEAFCDTTTGNPTVTLPARRRG